MRSGLRATESKVISNSSWSIWSVAVVLVTIFTNCSFNAGQQPSPVPDEVWPSPVPTLSAVASPVGQIVTTLSPGGAYHLYLPTTLAPNPDIIVLVHGTPGQDETEAEVARYYIKLWLDVAEQQRAILIAPVFDNANYSSKDGEQALGGYRGLFGRNIGADDFVLGLVDDYQHQFGSVDERFYLYGHSAGGQFTARFIVKHPHRIKGAVITAAATYPQPHPDIPWPFGLGELHTKIQWRSPARETVVDYAPKLEDWLTATTLPVTVIVGMNDLEWQPNRTGQVGHNRVVLARNWVKTMHHFAAQHGVTATIKLSVIPNLGHSAYGLVPYSQKALVP